MPILVKRIALLAAAAAAILVSNSGPALAAEGWWTPLSCGPNAACRLNSNTTMDTTHNDNQSLWNRWTTGGSHTSTKSWAASYQTVAVATNGQIISRTASCYCPSGRSNCAV